MKAEVRYFTRSGNTKLLAEAIADAVDAKAKSVETDLTEHVDVLFLGSSLYAGTYDAAIGDFVRRNADKIGLLVNFGSSASGKSTYKKIRMLAESYGIKVCSKEFVCPGHFLFLHKDRPNAEDRENIAAFAKSVL